jgi:hypothetical protein
VKLTFTRDTDVQNRNKVADANAELIRLKAREKGKAMSGQEFKKKKQKGKGAATITKQDFFIELLNVPAYARGLVIDEFVNFSWYTSRLHEGSLAAGKVAISNSDMRILILTYQRFYFLFSPPLTFLTQETLYS